MQDLTSFVRIAIVFGIILSIMLMMYDDGVPFAIIKRIRCKLGWHKMRNKIGRLRVHSYYCRFCKKPRKHPVLKIVDGGKKIGNNSFKF